MIFFVIPNSIHTFSEAKTLFGIFDIKTFVFTKLKRE
jgi:hypothetical protein